MARRRWNWFLPLFKGNFTVGKLRTVKPFGNFVDHWKTFLTVGNGLWKTFFCQQKNPTSPNSDELAFLPEVENLSLIAFLALVTPSDTFFFGVSLDDGTRPASIRACLRWALLSSRFRRLSFFSRRSYEKLLILKMFFDYWELCSTIILYWPFSCAAFRPRALDDIGESFRLRHRQTCWVRRMRRLAGMRWSRGASRGCGSSQVACQHHTHRFRCTCFPEIKFETWQIYWTIYNEPLEMLVNDSYLMKKF